LEEINRCHPYFIGMLGERYGWSPSDDGLTVRQENEPESGKHIRINNHELKEKVREWNEAEASVTSMEIMLGVLENKAQQEYSYFYFRDKELTKKLFYEAIISEPSTSESAFLEAEQSSKYQKLTALKERIRKKAGSWHVYINKENGSDTYNSVKEFGEQVRANLKDIIDELFPEGAKISDIQRERNFHTAFARSRLESYIPNENVFQELDTHFLVDNPTPLIITGDMGSGKSALLANYVAHWKKANPQGFVIEHYAGAGGESDASGVLLRVMREINGKFAVDEELPKDTDDIYSKFAEWLLRIPRDEKYLLAVDGINQFRGKEGELRRFIFSFPAHGSVLMGMLPSEALDAVKEREKEVAWKVKTVSPLNEQERRKLAVDYLARYKKETGLGDLLDELIKHEHASNPLFLRVVLDELRIDANHDTLATMLNDYLTSQGLVELFEKVIARCEKAYQQSHVREVLTLIYAARYGLSETELLDIINEGDEKRAILPQRFLSAFVYGLGGYLADREGLYDFMHDALRLAVGNLYINSESERNARQKIAHYFSKVDVTQRQIDELPWHLVQLNEKRHLLKYVGNIYVIKEFSTRWEWNVELSAYWRAADYDASKISLSIDQKLGSLNTSDFVDFVPLVGDLYNFMGHYSLAEKLFRRLLLAQVDRHGAEHLDVASAMYSLASVLVELGSYQEASDAFEKSIESRKHGLGGEDPLTLKSVEALAYLMDRCGKYKQAENLHRKNLDIRKRVFAENHDDVISSLHGIAFELDNQNKLSEAEEIYRGIVEVRRRKLGDIHPHTLKTVNNLVYCLFRQKKYEEAELLGRSVVEKRKAVFGGMHPLTLNSTYGYSMTLLHSGRISEAEATLKKLVKRGLSVFDEQHPLYLTYLFGYGVSLENQAKFSRAEDIFRSVLDQRCQILGDRHPNTEISFSHLIRFLEKQGRSADVLQINQRYPLINYSNKGLKDTT